MSERCNHRPEARADGVCSARSRPNPFRMPVMHKVCCGRAAAAVAQPVRRPPSRGPHVFQERRRVALSHCNSIVARPVGRVRERVDHAARRAGAGRADADSRRHDGGDGAGVLGQHVRGGDRRDDARRFAVVLHGPHARPAPAERPRALLAVARHDAALRA
ncbi:hypothetical protein EMIT0111MI5_10337 [Burkholderia sp. IT-111MI5]